MKNFNVVAQSLVSDSIKKEFIIEAESEELAKEIAMNRMIEEETNNMLLDSPSMMMTAEEISLTPRNITNIIDNIEFYIGEMRKNKDDETIPKNLKEYAWQYFRDVEIDKEKLKGLAVFVVDKVYRVVANLTVVDNYTRAFFAKVIPFFWDTFSNRGVDIFYIVDNTFKNDGKFEAIVELFQFTGMAVVTPYNESGVLDYETVEKQIKEYMAPLRMIMYLEKDASVNYLDQILKLAKESQSLSIFRNKASNDSQVELLN